MKALLFILTITLFLADGLVVVQAQVPQLISYQGRVSSGGAPFNGSGQFKFALVNGNGSTFFWRNDGGAGVGEPTNAVTAPVTNGLFNIILGDTAIPGMAAIPPGVFVNSNVNLRIWFNDGAGGFSQLAPDQRIVAVGYALVAANVPDGSITGAKIAAGTITAVNIAPGGIDGSRITSNSITSVQLAPGAVGTTELKNPYQFGAISLESYTPSTGFLSQQINSTVNFQSSFQRLPIITLSLETSLKTAAGRVSPILVSSKTTNSFNLKFTLPNLPVSIDSRSSIGRAALAVVDGFPAAVYAGETPVLKFARAQDALGERWSASLTVDNVSCYDNAMAIINGNPAIAYVDFAGNVKFVRANDVDGTSWPARVVVHAASSGTFLASGVSLAVISGRPAIAVWDYDGNEVFYFRANDVNGASWPASGTQVGTSNGFVSLADVGGQPAIAFSWDNGQPQNGVGYQTEVRFIRANDVTGTNWPATPVSISTGGPNVAFDSVQLLVVSGSPAVFYGYDQTVATLFVSRIQFKRATTASGSAWGTAVDPVPAQDQPYSSLVAALVGGSPAAVFYSYKNQTLFYAVSLNSGASFNFATAFNPAKDGFFSLADVQGRPAFTFSDAETVDLRYMRDGNPIPDTYINWIAIEP